MAQRRVVRFVAEMICEYDNLWWIGKIEGSGRCQFSGALWRLEKRRQCKNGGNNCGQFVVIWEGEECEESVVAHSRWFRTLTKRTVVTTLWWIGEIVKEAKVILIQGCS
jgi:hypothetical protein